MCMLQSEPSLVDLMGEGSVVGEMNEDRWEMKLAPHSPTALHRQLTGPEMTREETKASAHHMTALEECVGGGGEVRE